MPSLYEPAKSQNQPAITKSEREELQRLVLKREKVLKSAAKQRSAELLADFENQMGQNYSFDQDETWAAAMNAAEQEVAKAQARVAVRCAELGIPKQFAPELDVRWYSRGENAVKDRRAELRKMAMTRVEAIEREAITKIEVSSLEAQTRLAIAGLTSEAARQFISELPPLEKLMPPLSFAEMSGEAKPPVAEQLVSPGALRQRRWREKQKQLKVDTLSVTADGRYGDVTVTPLRDGNGSAT